MTDTAIVAAAAVFVTAVAAGIAYGQWRTAQWKLAADLYPLRYAAYQKLMDAFELWYRQGSMNDEKYDTFISAFQSARYVFGTDVRVRLDKARIEITNLFNAEVLIQKYEDSLGDRIEEDKADKLENEKRWKEAQRITTSLYNLYTNEELFLPYLAIEYVNPVQNIPRPKSRRKRLSEEQSY